MKTFFLTMVGIAFTIGVLAQSPDKSLAKVMYAFTHLKDTTQKEKPYKANMVLLIGKNASLYTNHERLNRELELQKKIEDQIKNQSQKGKEFEDGLRNGMMAGLSEKYQSDIDYYFFAIENKFITMERVLNNYLVSEDIPKINWKILKDTASFSGVKCQKATADFKGRNWIAWFAPDLPFQNGPWKLNGLPGLIIEAYDTKKEISFQFAGIEIIKEVEAKTDGVAGVAVVKGKATAAYEIRLPANAIHTTRKELDKLKAARDKDPKGLMNAQMHGGSGGGQFNMVKNPTMATGSSSAPESKVVNNPIELPESKGLL